MNFVKFLRTPFLKEHLWWLLLNLRLTTSTRICQLRSNLIADSRVTSEKTRKSLVLALLLIFNNLNLRSLFLIKLQAVSLNHQKCSQKAFCPEHSVQTAQESQKQSSGASRLPVKKESCNVMERLLKLLQVCDRVMLFISPQACSLKKCLKLNDVFFVVCVHMNVF